jgi:molecular chaperone GrpE
MFPKKNNPSPDPKGVPEGQPEYLSIDDASDGSEAEGRAGGDEALARLRSELDEVNDRWKRAMADFQNYQRRALQNEQEARRQGVTAVLNSLVPVLDHFDLALAQSPADASGASIIEGVKVIRSELLKALEAHGVTVISPTPDTEFDPLRHQALAQQAAPGISPGRISAVFQPGYELYERVIRPAKVAVAPTP